MSDLLSTEELKAEMVEMGDKLDVVLKAIESETDAAELKELERKKRHIESQIIRAKNVFMQLKALGL